MSTKSITLALDVSEVEPMEGTKINGLYRVQMSHPKLEGQLEVVGTLSTLKVMIESLGKDTSEPTKGSVEGILTSIKELVSITRSIKKRA